LSTTRNRSHITNKIKWSKVGTRSPPLHGRRQRRKRNKKAIAIDTREIKPIKKDQFDKNKEKDLNVDKDP
jgi:hypothetical protein